MSAAGIIVTSSQEDAGTRLMTAVRDVAPPAGPVLRARDTVTLTQTVPCRAGLAVETISASTPSISRCLSTPTTPPGSASARQTTAATGTATNSTESAAMARLAAAMTTTAWPGWSATPTWTSPSVWTLTSVT